MKMYIKQNLYYFSLLTWCPENGDSPENQPFTKMESMEEFNVRFYYNFNTSEI
jgi:hypothetical protein